MANRQIQHKRREGGRNREEDWALWADLSPALRLEQFEDVGKEWLSDAVKAAEEVSDQSRTRAPLGSANPSLRSVQLRQQLMFL